jgi:hypothetical protein
MKPDAQALKVAFRKREIALEKIIRQMKDDNLQSSTVYRNLEQELKVVKTKLSAPLQGND